MPYFLNSLFRSAEGQRALLLSKVCARVIFGLDIDIVGKVVFGICVPKLNTLFKKLRGFAVVVDGTCASF